MVRPCPSRAGEQCSRHARPLAIGVRDLAASRAFYEAALAPLGFAVVMERDDRVAFGPTQRPIFFLVDREPTRGHPHRLPGE